MNWLAHWSGSPGVEEASGLVTGRSGFTLLWFPWLGFPPTPWWFHSQVGFPHRGTSRCHSSTPSIQRKKDISFIDSLLRMRKLLFQKLPAAVSLASDWGHWLVFEPIPMPKWMLCPLWLRLSFSADHCWKNNGFTFPETYGLTWGREIIKWKSRYH